MMIAFAALALLAGSAPAAAPDGAAAPAPAAKEKKICKEQGPMTGSRLRSARVCRTASEWADYEARQEELGRIPFTKGVPPPPRPGPSGN
ncbi:MAG: hypothetical protein ACEQR8_11240 [Cypionkella sp.]